MRCSRINLVHDVPCACSYFYFANWAKRLCNNVVEQCVCACVWWLFVHLLVQLCVCAILCVHTCHVWICAHVCLSVCVFLSQWVHVCQCMYMSVSVCALVTGHMTGLTLTWLGCRWEYKNRHKLQNQKEKWTSKAEWEVANFFDICCDDISSLTERKRNTRKKEAF